MRSVGKGRVTSVSKSRNVTDKRVSKKTRSEVEEDTRTRVSRRQERTSVKETRNDKSVKK